MAFIPAPNVVQVEMRALRNAQNIENRIMIDVLTPPTPTILEQVATICWDWWELMYAIVLSNGVLLRETVATDQSELNGGQFTYAPDTTTTGLRTGLAFPNEVAVCISLRTGSRGRSARGRLYTLSVSANQMVDENNLSSVAAAEIASVGNDLITRITAAGYLPVIVSYVSNKVPRPGGPVYFPITSAVLVDNQVDSMKRRKPGIGN
jgi:hypothetical protein